MSPRPIGPTAVAIARDLAKHPAAPAWFTDRHGRADPPTPAPDTTSQAA